MQNIFFALSPFSLSLKFPFLIHLIFWNIFIDLNSAGAREERSTFSLRQIAFSVLFAVLFVVEEKFIPSLVNIHKIKT